jgi:hypothetical protein
MLYSSVVTEFYSADFLNAPSTGNLTSNAVWLFCKLRVHGEARIFVPLLLATRNETKNKVMRMYFIKSL